MNYFLSIVFTVSLMYQGSVYINILESLRLDPDLMTDVGLMAGITDRTFFQVFFWTQFLLCSAVHLILIFTCLTF